LTGNILQTDTSPGNWWIEDGLISISNSTPSGFLATVYPVIVTVVSPAAGSVTISSTTWNFQITWMGIES